MYIIVTWCGKPLSYNILALIEPFIAPDIGSRVRGIDVWSVGDLTIPKARMRLYFQ